MKKWRILSLGVTEISLHPMLLLYMLYAFLTGHGLYMLIALLSILLHECAHAVVATLFGRQPRSIELSPLGAVMKLEDENALTPVKRGIMLLAGPAITLTLCLTAIILTSQRLLSVSCGRMLFLSNLAILLLNLF